MASVDRRAVSILAKYRKNFSKDSITKNESLPQLRGVNNLSWDGHRDPLFLSETEPTYITEIHNITSM